MKCIYAIINLENGKKYIGSATNFARRQKDHIKALNNKCHHSTHLQRAWDKYNQENFKFVVLEEVTNSDDLYPKEQVYLDKYLTYEGDKGYNMSKIAKGGMPSIYWLPVKQFDLQGNFVKEYESVAKAANENSVEQSMITATCRGVQAKHKGFIWIYSKDFTDELLKQKILLAPLPKKHTAQGRLNMSKAQKNRKYTKEGRLKMGEAQKRRDNSTFNISAIQKISEEKRKPIYVYDLDTNYIETVIGWRQCVIKYGNNVSTQLHKKGKPKKFIFSYTKYLK